MSSGAQNVRLLSIEIDGEQKEYVVKPNAFSSRTLGLLRALLIKRRREARRATMEDMAKFVREMGKEAGSAFAKEMAQQVTAGSEQDYKVDIMEGVGLVQSGDEEALTVILSSCLEGISGLSEARKILDSCDDLTELVDTVFDAANEDSDAAKNSGHQPETEQVP